jgi:hypothetical protein
VGLIHALIHRSAWNRNSANFAANFAFIEFYEVRGLGILRSSSWIFCFVTVVVTLERR